MSRRTCFPIEHLFIPVNELCIYTFSQIKSYHVLSGDEGVIDGDKLDILALQRQCLPMRPNLDQQVEDNSDDDGRLRTAMRAARPVAPAIMDVIRPDRHRCVPRRSSAS
jgi:hypothetical protein